MATSNIFFTSDLHFLHNNIIKYCNRPTNEYEHTQWLINIINKDLNDKSEVYHVGDFTGKYKNKYSEVEYIISQLKGNWNFIKGNHDNEKQLQNILKGTRHKWLGDYHEIKHNKKSIILFHYPIQTWNKKHFKSIHLHGHSHGRNEHIIPCRHDVGIDIAHRLFNIDEVLDETFNEIDLKTAYNQFKFYKEDNNISDDFKFGQYIFGKHDIEFEDSYNSNDYSYILNALKQNLINK